MAGVLWANIRRPVHCSDGLHHFSCDFQRGPSWGYMVRRILLPFASFQNWHGRIMPVEYFGRVLLICRLPPRFPCARTYNMSPCRKFLQNPIHVCRLVLGTAWGRILFSSSGSMFLAALDPGKSESSYSLPLVMRKIY